MKPILPLPAVLLACLLTACGPAAAPQPRDRDREAVSAALPIPKASINRGVNPDGSAWVKACCMPERPDRRR